MQLAPDQAAIKCLLRDIVTHGDQARIANILGVSPADISHRFDPNSDRKLALVEGLREAWAVAGANEDAGRKLRSYIEGLFESWLGSVTTSDKDLSALVGDASKEVSDLVIARLEGKPIATQRKEALEARTVIDQFLVGLESKELRAV